MLKALKIENIAIIEYADIEFTRGLNVLSGETGAGKSIIIDALSAVLGERTSKELVRTGAPFARVSAEFADVSSYVRELVSSMGAAAEDDSLIISRTINSDGRNICRVNGFPMTVTMLKTIGKELISIHGQHDSQNLLNPEFHYRYLDDLGDYDSLISDYTEKYEEYVRLYRKYKAIMTNEEELNRKVDLLKFEINEIESANLVPNEIAELQAKRELYKNIEKVRNGLQNALAALDDGENSNGALTLLFNSVQALNAPVQHLPDIVDSYKTLQESAYNIKACREDIADVLYSCSFDERDRAEVEDRLAEIRKLQLKYGETEEVILQYLSEQKEELALIEYTESDRENLEKILSEKKDILIASAEGLSKARKKQAELFEEKVSDELRFLNMPNVVISTSFERCKLNRTGCDVIEFLISPNPGESLKPLAKIASGGELSRIMLAIQNVLSSKGNVTTMIFDEIDTGVSGSAAEKIARKLSTVSEKFQVLCVTHSPQVASYADSHYLISKEVINGKTYTNVMLLDFEGRAYEIARIIGGEEITDLGLETAREMLERAETIRKNG